MKPYSQLGMRARANRLRIAASVSLQRYDIDVDSLRLHWGTDHCIIEVKAVDGRAYALRISLGRREIERVRAETAWLAALNRDTDLDVPEPLPMRGGQVVAKARVPGLQEGRYAVLFRWMPGPPMTGRRLSCKNMSMFGEFVASLHGHAGSFGPAREFRIPRYDRTSGYTLGEVSQESCSGILPLEDRAVLANSVAAVEEVLRELFSNDRELHVIHGDFSPLHARLHDGKLGLLDFANIGWGHPVLDISALFSHFGDVPMARTRMTWPKYHALFDAFRHGYSSRRTWPEQHPGQVNTLVVGHFIGVAGPRLEQVQDHGPARDIRQEILAVARALL